MTNLVLRVGGVWMVMGALTLAVVVAFFWPNSYISMASIRVVPPAVPDATATLVKLDVTFARVQV